MKTVENTDHPSCPVADTKHVELTSEYDVGKTSAAVGVQHVGPHVHRLLQAAVAAAQSWEGSPGVVERRGGWGRGRVKARTSCCRAHRVFQQTELVQLHGRWWRDRKSNDLWVESSGFSSASQCKDIFSWKVISKIWIHPDAEELTLQATDIICSVL